MDNKTCLLLFITAALAAPAIAADKPAKPAVSVDDDTLFKISFRIKAEELSDAGSFVGQAGSEADYHVGGEPKKHVTSVSCVPVTDPNNGLIHAECQFEISGALRPTEGSKETPTLTFQYKGSFEVRPGKTLVLVDDETRRLEIKIEELKP